MFAVNDVIAKLLKIHWFFYVFCDFVFHGFDISQQTSSSQPCSFRKAKFAKIHCFSMFAFFNGLRGGVFFDQIRMPNAIFWPELYRSVFKKCYKNQCCLTISFAVNSQFIATSTFVVNLRKHEIVKIPLVFVPFWQLCFGKTSYCESKIHRNLRSKRKIPFFLLQQRSNIEKPNR